MDFSEIREAYKNLADNDAWGAARLKTDAALLQETFETELAHLKCLAAQFKVQLEATFARRSKELAPGRVSEGERLAKIDDEYLLAAEEYSQAVLAVNLKEAQIRFLEKVYFDTKFILDRANKKMYSDRGE